MTTYAAVLRKPEMRAIFVAHGVSLTGSVAAEVALSVLVFQRTSSPLLSALTLACAFVPQAFSAVLLSGLADRVPPRRLLVGCDLLCALLVTGMVLPGMPVVWLLLLAAVTGLVTPLFGGARSATLADLLEGDEWVLARSVLRVLSQSALLVGFAVGGLVLAVVGSRTLLLADAVSFLGSALLLRLGTTARPARSAERSSPRDGVRATVQALRMPVLRRLLLLTWLPATWFSTVDALATPYAGKGRPEAVGLLLAAAAAGSILAEALGARLRIASRPRLVLPVALLTGSALVLYALHPPIWLAVGLNLVGALGGATGQWVDRQVLEQMPGHLRGQLLSLQGGFMMATQGLGIAAAGALAEVLPAHQVLAGFGVLALLTPLALLPVNGSSGGAHGAPHTPAASVDAAVSG